jgi:uridylate kinase
MKPAFKRVLIKLSGESLSGEPLSRESHSGVDRKACDVIVSAIKSVHKLGVQIAIVVGGGNFFRGALAKEFNLGRVPADHIGMLATMMNGIFLSEALKKASIDAVVMGSKDYGGVAEVFNHQVACEYLDQNKVLIFAGGIGHPYFTTDSAAALRACEIQAEVLLKATKVNGIYNKDPMKYSDAKKYDTLTYAEALSEDLKVMDATAIALCRESNIPIFVFDLFSENAFVKAVCGLEDGTKVS